MAKGLKAKAWAWCSRYCRLRDALDYCRQMGIDIRGYSRIEELPVKCVDCDRVDAWIYTDAGHFFGRGLGGDSGVYFDERNIHAQNKLCNSGFRGDSVRVAHDYKKFMLERYGQQIIDELTIKHHGGSKCSTVELMALAEYYKQRYEELQERE